jgi:hypothetical protein
MAVAPGHDAVVEHVRVLTQETAALRTSGSLALTRYVPHPHRVVGRAANAASQSAAAALTNAKNAGRHKRVVTGRERAV